MSSEERIVAVRQDINTERVLKDLSSDFSRLFERLPAQRKANWVEVRDLLILLPRAYDLITGQVTGRIAGGLASAVATFGTANLVKIIPASELGVHLALIAANFQSGTAHHIERQIVDLFLRFANTHKDTNVLGDLLVLGYKFWPNIAQVLNAMVFPVITANVDSDILELAVDIIDFVMPACELSGQAAKHAATRIYTNSLIQRLIQAGNLSPRTKNLIDTLIKSVIENIISSDIYSGDQKKSILTNFKRIILFVQYTQLVAELKHATKQKNPKASPAQIKIIKDKIAAVCVKVNTEGASAGTTLDFKDLIFTKEGRLKPEITDTLKIVISVLVPTFKEFLHSAPEVPLVNALDLAQRNPDEFIALDLASIELEGDKGHMLAAAKEQLKAAQVVLRSMKQDTAKARQDAFDRALQTRARAKQEVSSELRKIHQDKEQRLAVLKQEIQDVQARLNLAQPGLATALRELETGDSKDDSIGYILNERILSTRHNYTGEKTRANLKANPRFLAESYESILEKLTALKLAHSQGKNLEQMQAKCDELQQEIKELKHFVASGGAVAYNSCQRLFIEQLNAVIAANPRNYPGKNQQEKIQQAFRLFIERKFGPDYGGSDKGGARLISAVQKEERDFHLLGSLNKALEQVEVVVQAIDRAKTSQDYLREQQRLESLKVQAQACQEDETYIARVAACEAKLSALDAPISLADFDAVVLDDASSREERLNTLKNEARRLIGEYQDSISTPTSTSPSDSDGQPEDTAETAESLLDRILVAVMVTLRFLAFPFVMLGQGVSKLFNKFCKLFRSPDDSSDVSGSDTDSHSDDEELGMPMAVVSSDTSDLLAPAPDVPPALSSVRRYDMSSIPVVPVSQMRRASASSDTPKP